MTNIHSPTLLSLVIPVGLLLGAAIAAREVSAAPAGAQESVIATPAIATISNGLPVDGCSYPVTIDGVDYAPTDESIAPFRDVVPGGGSLTLRINYSLTGRVGRVACGFGASWELPEISFRAAVSNAVPAS